ncbi:MAG: DUF6064 family protein [Hydrogenophaga sp.]|uniref:DUF6064 family protein n=1 Tax=Hydrogenophaga sp. TaxID=1904254 RepID=UPI003D1494A1
MSEWWTYRPSDLLMFAPRTYWRLFELHNEAIWPAPALTALVALGLAGALWRGRSGALRAGLAVLAACWALVAWAFLWQRYAPINTAGSAFAIAFAVQAAGLLMLSLWGGFQIAGDGVPRRTGMALLVWSVLGHPWLSWLFGRPWSQAEFFGLAPDPTAIGTLGVLLCVASCRRSVRGLWGALWVVALLWCAVSATTLWTMGAAQGWIPALAAALAVVARQRA